MEHQVKSDRSNPCVFTVNKVRKVQNSNNCWNVKQVNLIDGYIDKQSTMTNRGRFI